MYIPGALMLTIACMPVCIKIWSALLLAFNRYNMHLDSIPWPSMPCLVCVSGNRLCRGGLPMPTGIIHLYPRPIMRSVGRWEFVDFDIGLLLLFVCVERSIYFILSIIIDFFSFYYSVTLSLSFSLLYWHMCVLLLFVLSLSELSSISLMHISLILST